MQFELVIIILLIVNIILNIFNITKKINIEVIIKNEDKTFDNINKQESLLTKNSDIKSSTELNINAILKSVPKASGFGN